MNAVNALPVWMHELHAPDIGRVPALYRTELLVLKFWNRWTSLARSLDAVHCGLPVEYMGAPPMWSKG